ncbi:MAG TPA: RcnB family protein [Burkholderiales bacterium]|nr:RcnB family protein [Burkholderiales bacterium]
MQKLNSWPGYAVALAVAALIAAGSAFADKPPWAGGGKAERQGAERQERSRDGDRGRAAHQPADKHFSDRHSVIVRDYYGAQFTAGRCPPGLAKKHNGCMPPGQAKKWAIGRPLPRDVVYYDLPPALVVDLGRPPAGYRYVRVAADILLIAIGTGMVVDAIQDLGGR